LENIPNSLHQENFEFKLNQLRVKLEEERILRQTLDEEHNQEILALKKKIDALETVRAQPFHEGHFAYSAHEQVAKPIEESEDSSLRATYPGSCGDLARNGHTSDGIYLVGNELTQRIEARFCNFGTGARMILYFIDF